VTFQDFPGPGSFKKKIQDFPGGVGTLCSRVKTQGYTLPAGKKILNSVNFCHILFKKHVNKASYPLTPIDTNTPIKALLKLFNFSKFFNFD